MNKNHHFLVSSLYFTLFLVWVNITKNNADQSTNLFNLLKSKRSQSPDLSASWAEFRAQIDSVRVHVGSQDGLMQSDKVTALPGQPDGVDFDQYAGYVTVDPDAGKELFYYFVECPHNSSSKPLVLWLNGGPGCSSFGNGALQELGPFRVNSDGKSLFLNHYGWHHLANVIFLESPAGVGFSYGKNSSKIYGETGDTSTAKDSYAFLVNWLERFPQYKSRDFYITGESYAGHYIPQLAYTILQHNKAANHTFINLKAVALGNAWIDDAASSAGLYDFLWTHALYSDGTHSQLLQYCSDFSNATSLMSDACNDASQKALNEIGSIDIYNIYAPLCSNPALSKSPTLSSVEVYDPCSSTYVDAYLNIPEVQKALHARPTNWSACSGFDWKDSPSTVLPVVRRLMDSNVSVWVYSGDVDGRVPVTSSKYAINKLKLPIKTPWRPWYFSKQVGGYVVEYEGLAFVTVRGAGHLVPTYQPQRAFDMISSFLNGTLPPPR